MSHIEEEFFSLKSTVSETSQDLSNSTELNRQLVKTVVVKLLFRDGSSYEPEFFNIQEHPAPSLWIQQH